MQVEVLSGGEKARLALAKFMLTQGTLLVLDEPTNHLDIPSKEMLEEALLAFEGSVIAVTHDRYFLRRTMTRIVTVGMSTQWLRQIGACPELSLRRCYMCSQAHHHVHHHAGQLPLMTAQGFAPGFRVWVSAQTLGRP